jgi:hypothetical protein
MFLRLQIVGDASVNAFYRLGIGINTALVSIAMVGEVVTDHQASSLSNTQDGLNTMFTRMADVWTIYCLGPAWLWIVHWLFTGRSDVDVQGGVLRSSYGTGWCRFQTCQR